MKRYIIIILIALLTASCAQRTSLFNDYSTNANAAKNTFRNLTKMELVQSNLRFKLFSVIKATDYNNDGELKYLMLCVPRKFVRSNYSYSKIEGYDIINPPILFAKETEKLINYLKQVNEDLNSTVSTDQAEYNEFVLSDAAKIGTTVRLLFSNNYNNTQFSINFVEKEKMFFLSYNNTLDFIEMLEEGLRFLNSN